MFQSFGRKEARNSDKMIFELEIALDNSIGSLTIR